MLKTEQEYNSAIKGASKKASTLALELPPDDHSQRPLGFVRAAIVVSIS
ncbi:hypothetical protein ABIB80_007903 [Bradyrhizobium sp. i1.15.2]